VDPDLPGRSDAGTDAYCHHDNSGTYADNSGTNAYSHDMPVYGSGSMNTLRDTLMALIAGGVMEFESLKGYLWYLYYRFRYHRH